ncbi:type I restriction-modification system subunit M N-terminal domain-containing protein, partial [Acidithiobacillus sp. MC6.1]|nr:type I restriction-modification system subunit M N-terminal domain-containing protein [Acidithiobacillus sp. MC6.1]
MPMPGGRRKTTETPQTEKSLESTLWAAADKLRGHLDAADYKQVVLDLIFLKYISDAFAHRYRELVAEADSG